MSTQDSAPRDELLRGTLDLLILRTVAFGPQHGQGIARIIEQRSGDTLLIDHGSLYPALQRLEDRAWLRAAWGVSANNRRARFYTLTAAGRRQLTAELGRWQRLVAAVNLIVSPDPLTE